MVFVIITALSVPLIYWYFPETKGLSLEEIDELFGDKVIVHLTHISDEEKVELDRKMLRSGEDPILAAKGASVAEIETAGDMPEK